MDVTHLEPDELEYELKLRRLRTMQRSQSISPLRKLIEKECRGEIPRPTGIPPIADLNFEKNFCIEKADTLERLANVAVATQNPAELRWIKSRLIHFLNRVNLLAKADPTAEEEVSEIGGLMRDKLATIIKELAEKGEEGAVGPSPRSLEAIREFAEEGGIPKTASESIPETCSYQKTLESNTRQIDPVYTLSTITAPIMSTRPCSIPNTNGHNIMQTSVRGTGAIPKRVAQSQGSNEISRPTDAMSYVSHEFPNEPEERRDLRNKVHEREVYASDREPLLHRNRRTDDFWTPVCEGRPVQSRLAAGEDHSIRKSSLPGSNNYPLELPTNNRQIPTVNPYVNYSSLSQPEDLFRRPQPLPIQRHPQPENYAQYQRPQVSLNEQYSSTRRNGGNPVANWQIRFDGTSRDIAIDDFLFRVETLARADGVPQNTLVYAIHQLLTGRASTWYWQFCRKVPRATWHQLSYSLRREFEDQTTDYEIKRLMETRKQRPRERFGDFRLELEGLALRLREPMNPRELLEILKRNMHPALRKTLILRDFNNIDELDGLCRQVEKMWSEVGETAEDQVRSRRYNVHEVDYDDYGAIPNEKHVECEFLRQGDIMEVNKVKKDPFIICWNCEDLGHTFKYCPINTGRVFCYTCGAKNVMRPNCFRCVKGNMGAGQGMRGPRNPPNVILTPQPSRQKSDQATMTERTPYLPFPRISR